MPWLILALMGAFTFIYGLATHAMLLCLLVKPLPLTVLRQTLQTVKELRS